MSIEFEKLTPHVDSHSYPLMFATISGAHLYGFPSPDSDFDLRGVHVLPVEEVVGLGQPCETVEKEGVFDGLEIDLVTHDAAKFFGLMLRRNGYVLEQIFSPLVVQSSSQHDELKAIALDCVTKHHAHHYLGFAATQWKLFQKASPPRVKPLLYLYRVLMTGIRLMRTGKIEANLSELCHDDPQVTSMLMELIQRKCNGAEKETLAEVDLAFHERNFHRLVAQLEKESERSALPDLPSGKPALNDLLLRLRLG